jgi:DNA-binding CsgD family transcriptional regulator/tetratricopeptide (TPR) repeat protein
VTEIIAGGGTAIPATIQDAVLARVARLSPDARAVLDAAAAIGIVVDSDLLESVVGAPIEMELDECLASGVLRTNDDAMIFRHALTRDVLYETISPARRRGLHRRILEDLERRGFGDAEAATLAHHADRARLPERARRYASMAASYAARLGAHREAAAQLARALRHAEGLSPAELVALLEARSYECYLTGQLDEAIADCQRAIDLRRNSRELVKVGDNLRALSRYLWFSGRGVEAAERATEALELLEPLPPGPELAMAYSNISQLRMLAHDGPGAITWGNRAIALARELDHQPILAHALTNVGSAYCFTDFDAGQRLIEEAVEIARACDLHDDVVRALTNLGWASIEQYDLETAERYIREAIAFTVEHDIVGMEIYLRGLDCRALLARGLWNEAEHNALQILERPGTVASSRIVANTVIAHVRSRQGGDGREALDEALRLAEQIGELQRLGPVRAARAEAAWLAGDPERAAAEAAHEFEHARRANLPWMAGNLALWMQRGGRTITDSRGLAEPFALEIDGRGEEAAAIWRARGFPLETARSLASTGVDEHLRAAHAMFDRLNARPDLGRVVQAMRAAGTAQIPRGPRAGTRVNPAGLTARELDVLMLIIEGRTNREIAERLFLSHRTVGHHVSAILGKLDIESRDEAGARAEALGLVQDRSPIAAK